MASVDTIQITVPGRGGHGAVPDQTVDALVAASALVLNLQTFVSRNVSPLKEEVITVGAFHSGISENIIANRAELKGTVRTLDSEIREQFPEWIQRTVENSYRAFGATGQIDYQKRVPVLSNDPQAAVWIYRSAERLLGEASVTETDLTLGGDDIALMLERVPGCYFRLGATPPDRPVRGWHSPHFNIDENSPSVGSAMLTQIALDYLFGHVGQESPDLGYETMKGSRSKWA